ncbi:hypothetical protein WA026_002617 [Henosepilachna vigintioctopunctata]|uniref:Fatty acyl-CoA reductase n=1 Tax=Henosepilachna vigintioctopunctata TaxID=420089 RepID=A0AAW1TTZ6_9CUCU
MSTQILKFYENSNVFITGGTGFLGKILIEKLLRSTSVSTLYVLVRKKKGKNAETRMKELFDDVIFQRLHAECPKYIHRVVGINGDVSFPDLGMSQSDRQLLIDKIDVVFHAAATMRFDENLKLAYNVNVNGAKAILELGKQMKNLKSLIHISTAFSNCYLEDIEEKFYEYNVNYDEVGNLLKKMTESQADFHTPRIIGSWPNTYTFTKALAESMISQTSGALPVGVFRPSIVISTNKEPIEGWIDNMYGPTGVCAGVSTGLLRVIYCDREKKADLVPVDMCVAALIASAWDTSQKNKRSPEDIPIYNYVGTENSFTWFEYCTVNQMYNENYPSNRCIWPISLHLTTNIYLYMLMKLFYHLIPALVIDLVSMLFFRNFGMLGMYKKIHKFSDVLGFFRLENGILPMIML